MKNLKQLEIGNVSKESGVPVSTLHYYEKKGLIKPISRKGLKRVYGQNVLEQLSLIALAKYAGFTLQEISLMFTSSGRLKIKRNQLLEKADTLKITIERLKSMHKGLIHVANCPEKDQLNCPKFKKLVKKAHLIQKRTKK